ncbi:hypothetical protein T11_752, partial [Trichinella zimbabwensis]
LLISRDICKKPGSFQCINTGKTNFRGYLFHNYWTVYGKTFKNTI